MPIILQKNQNEVRSTFLKPLWVTQFHLRSADLILIIKCLSYAACLVLFLIIYQNSTAKRCSSIPISAPAKELCKSLLLLYLR